MKPQKIKDLMMSGNASAQDIQRIAEGIFDGETTAAGPAQGGLECYVITACKFTDLPLHVQGFIVKAILEFKVENVLDAAEDHDDGDDALELATLDGKVI